jgi:hypothetical protein
MTYDEPIAIAPHVAKPGQHINIFAAARALHLALLENYSAKAWWREAKQVLTGTDQSKGRKYLF